MVVLVTGANGQLGQAIQSISGKYPEIDFVFCSSSDLDITNLENCQVVFDEFKPQFCINAAAYTAVDKAESEPDQAFLINEVGVKNLAIACKHRDIPLIHISTDYVFAGNAKRPYQTTDDCDPQTVYGASKLAGELAIAAILPSHLIIRTAWLYSEYGSNFLKTMLRLANLRDSVSVVDDQIGCPTYAPDLAKVILAVADKLLEPHWQTYGIYHFVGNEMMSWFEFAKRIMTIRENISAKTVKVSAISSAQYPTAAKRPGYSVLAGQKLFIDFSIDANSTDTSAAIAHIIGKLG